LSEFNIDTTAQLSGWGKGLDKIYDSLIETLKTINLKLKSVQSFV